MKDTNYIKLKNAVIDDYLSVISGNDLKCYLFILRKTLGWNKAKDKISISQLIKNTGIKKRLTIINATAKLAELKLIKIHRCTGLINVYEPLPVPKIAVAKKDTSIQKSNAFKSTPLVAKKDTTTSSQKGYPTKDTNTKDILTKEKSKPKKEITLPDNLNIQAWDMWNDYKSEIKKKYKTTTGMQTAINKLSTLPYNNQRLCIESSISNEYQGFFTDKFTGVQNGTNQNNYRKESNAEATERAVKNLLQQAEQQSDDTSMGGNANQVPKYLEGNLF